MERKEVLFADLGSQLTPSSAINDRYTKFQWRAIPYTTAKVSGTMVSSVYTSDAPTLTLEPNLTGWYKIYLGLPKMADSAHVEVHVKLTNDKVYRTIVPEYITVKKNFIDECLWKCADMTGQSLEISQPHWAFPSNASLAFVRFVPMSDAEVAAYKADKARTDTKRLYATDDIHNILFNGPRNLDGFLTQVEQYRDSDVKVLSMEYLGFFDFARKDRVDIPRHFARDYEKNYTDTTRWLLKEKIDFYPPMIDYGHEMGLDMYLSMRMGFWSYQAPLDESFYCEFFEQHPELWMQDRDGAPVHRLSYAFPGTREFVMDHFSAMAKYECDGVDMIFNRGHPYVLFEQPVLDRVQELYGVDARTLPNNDERLMTVRAEIMTGFLRDLRARLDKERAERGQKRLRLAAHVHKNVRGNRFMGLDLATWIKEGLIDDIQCYPLEQHDELPDECFTDETHTVIDLAKYTEAVDNAPVASHQVWYDTSDNPEEETRELAALTKGTDVKLYVEIMPRGMSNEEFRQRAMHLYNCGIEGISLWDTYDRAKHMRQWNMEAVLGHKDELPTMSDGQGDVFDTHRILTLNGRNIARYTPNWGG